MGEVIQPIAEHGDRVWAAPYLFGLIFVTSGVHSGILAVAFPYLAAKAGLSLTAIGAIVGLTMSASVIKLVWTPVVDMGWTLRRWTELGVLMSMIGCAALLMLPLATTPVWLIGAVALIGQVGTGFVGTGGGGLMALAARPSQQGKAAGFWQAGNVGAIGVSGGLTLYLANNVGLAAAAIGAVLLCVPSLWAVRRIVEPARPAMSAPVITRLRQTVGDLFQVARDVRGLIVILIVGTPIGVGGASFVWSAIASEWRVGPDMIALVTGAGSAVASIAGALAFAAVADKYDRMLSFMVAGLLVVIAGVALAILPREPMVFVGGTLFYAFGLGAGYGAFTALILDVIGRGAEASKVAIIGAIGNAPVAYMPILNGWVHDRWSTTAMLWFEQMLTVGCMLLFVAICAAIQWSRRTTTYRIALAMPLGA